MRAFFVKLGGLLSAFPVLVVLLALCTASVFVIESATYLNDKLANAPVQQVQYLGAGLILFVILAFVPYRWMLAAAPFLYLLSIILLVAVFLPHMGRKVMGAYSWLKLGPVGFEPAEFAKLSFILCLAWMLHVRERHVQSIVTVLIAVVMTVVPAALILKQPALGTAGVFFPICFCMLFAAGARLRYIIPPILLVVGLALSAYYWIHVWDKPTPFLKDFQRHRIEVFFDPSMDKQGTSWAINQSLIAIGSGGMDGKGWRQGTENVGGYLPKNTSYNDLIFPVVGEEEGFRGGAALIICEGIVLLWCLWVAFRARDKVGALVAVGVMAMLFTHVYVNIGMTLQLVPITGIPLPFISYGGTFLIACLAALGLVQSVWVHRKNLERA